MTDKLQKPYWVAPFKGLPSWNFNREIIRAGSNDTFPQGVVGVRCDDDFWAVAALPYQEYIGKGIAEIVAEFWPECISPSFGPDNQCEIITPAAP